jgi:hypothetical protein
VHKDLQAPVTERVDKFIGDGGGLCLYVCDVAWYTPCNAWRRL